MTRDGACKLNLWPGGLALVLLVVVGAWTSRARAENYTLSAIAYNVHLLPDVALRIAGERGESRYRAERIGRQLAAYGLIGICEAFDGDHSRRLISSLQSHAEHELSIAYGPSRSGRHFIGSGLVLLSRWPIVERHTETYSHASRFVTSGFKADGFAAKGALHVRLRLGNQSGQQLDCFLTHLESRSSDARAKQIGQLAEFIARHASPQLPVLIMGDLNVAADPVGGLGQRTEYQQMLTALSAHGRRYADLGAAASTGTSDAIATDGGRRIDYLLVSNPTEQAMLQMVTHDTKHLRLLDERVPEGSLSDHMAVSCRLRLASVRESQR
ncbi:MAG: endonuclease/exonuclease/phosphatase family protein [Planctomycetota bacterium]